MIIREFLTENKYNIGFAENKQKDIIHGKPIRVNWMKHTCKIYADTFHIFNVYQNHIVVDGLRYRKPATTILF